VLFQDGLVLVIVSVSLTLPDRAFLLLEPSTVLRRALPGQRGDARLLAAQRCRVADECLRLACTVGLPGHKQRGLAGKFLSGRVSALLLGMRGASVEGGVRMSGLERDSGGRAAMWRSGNPGKRHSRRRLTALPVVAASGYPFLPSELFAPVDEDSRYQFQGGGE